MIILDTNVLSEMMKEELHPNVQAWLNHQDSKSLFTTTVTIMEVRFGIFRLPDGRRKEGFKEVLENILSRAFGMRILQFDMLAAENAARVAAETEGRGMNLKTADVQIAGIALARDMVVASRDEMPFFEAGVKLINPWSL